MIEEIQNVLTKKECEFIIDWARPKLKKSKVINTETYGKNESSMGRTSSEVVFWDKNNKKILIGLKKETNNKSYQ